MYKFCVFLYDINDHDRMSEYLENIFHHSTGKWIGFARGASNEGTIYLEYKQDLALLALFTDAFELFDNNLAAVYELGNESYYESYGANKKPYRDLTPNKYYTSKELERTRRH